MPALASLLRGPRGEIGYLGFVVFLGDNRTFALVLMIPSWDRELRVLKTETAHMTTALAIPALLPWIHPDCAEPITPVLPMGSLQNLHRSLVVDSEPVATGIQRRRALPYEPDVRPRRVARDHARVHSRRGRMEGG